MSVPPDCPLKQACKYFMQGKRDRLLRDVLEALCVRDGISLESSVVPGEPARNYELTERLGIGHVWEVRDEPG